MFDAYTEQRKEMLRQWGDYVDSPQWLNDRREVIIRWLGSRYLLHPANRVQRRTVPYGERSK
ncbi:hypothetical protein [Paraburkholderia caffeinilytica]|uniref:hypothetical protein n=1 Tax=Paraburkholderia caffeinilytica TaxID=1761016 RepID=UPI0038BCBC41